MSHHDYLMSRAIEGQDFPFYAIIMAAYRKADSDNQRKLFRAFPNTVEELTARYNAPGGVLESDVIKLPDGFLEMRPMAVDIGADVPPMTPAEEEAAIDDLFDRSDWPPRE